MTHIGGSATKVHRDDFIKVKESSIDGFGVFAKSKLASCQKIAYFKGNEIDHDTRHSLTLDGKRIEPTGELQYLNHSCAPNAHFHNIWLIASRDIFPYEEITIDYITTENKISHHFECKCGAKICRSRI